MTLIDTTYYTRDLSINECCFKIFDSTASHLTHVQYINYIYYITKTHCIIPSYNSIKNLINIHSIFCMLFPLPS